MVVCISKKIQSLLSIFKKKVGQKQDEQRKLTVHYTPSQHYQENVFTEGSKPQYLEDLHTEAQKGLEIFQQEEHKNGVNFQDDQTVSEEDASSRERDDSLETDSTAGHSVISVSTVSAVSSRPMLTSQGSTFKPLNPVKRLDKTRRRNRRTTIMGIPQQVQRELDMARGTILQQLHNGKHDDDDSSGTVVISKIDGDLHLAKHEGAHVHLQSIKDLQTSRDEELLRHHIQSVYQDDLSLNRKLEPGTCPMQRPKSLAVPGMTTSCFLHEPQGPVMSISPQATYLSKIIPNAIMPAAIDVIEINRCHNRRSASTVSKSSVTTASPAPSRSRLCINEDPPTTSPNRSHSQSSETIVSNSSTISSKERGPPTYVVDSTKEVSDLNPKDMSIASSKIWITSDRTCTRLQHQELSDAGENGRNSNSFSRSLSVMKTKLPPAPPQRTYSLHHEKLKLRSREWEDVNDFKVMVPNDGQIGKDLNYPKKVNQSTNKEKSSVNSSVPRSSKDFQTSVKSSPLSPDQALTRSHAESNNSSPQKIATGENKFDRTLSPSSGYSSQSGTPTHSPKEVSPSSPDKRRFKPSKPERASVRTSTVLSVSSSMTSLSSVTSDTAEQDIQTNTTSEAQKLSPPVSIVQSKVTPTPPTVTLRKLFNIPPPPKVKAPSPPPPETWIYKKRTFELLCGQGPNPYRLHQLQKQQNKPLICKNLNTNTVPNNEEIIPNKQSSDTERKTGSQLENKTIVLKEQNESVPPQEQRNILIELPALRHNESSKLQRNEQVSLQVRETDQIIHTNVSRKVEDRREEESQTVLKSELPTIEVDQSMLSEKYSDVNRGDELVNKTSTPKSNETNTENQNNSIVKDILNHKPMQCDLEVPKVNGISPSPSTPPEHYPPPPPSKITSASSVFTPPAHEEEHSQDKEEATSLESSWPPPPPPMDSADMMFEEPNELDFPPPPPSFIHEPLSEISNNFHESCEQHANIEFVSPTASDMTSSQKQRSKIDSIIPTRTERNYTVMEDRQHDNPQCCNNVSHLSMDPVHRENTTAAPPKMSFLSLVENTSTKYLEVPPKLPPISVQDSPVQASIDTQVNCTNVPLAPPLSVEDQSTVIFKRHLNYVNKDNRSKELICRNKSTPIQKEDANIPLVTPSLLQMVRLRSVNVGEDQINNDSKPSLEATANDEQIQNISSQATPQKPIRRSLTLKSNPPIKSSSATGTVPSMCLQEAIRMKTAALSSSGVPAMLNLRLSSTNSTSSPVPSPKTPDDCNLHRSPASTASFIFSKSTKKLVIETTTSPMTQTSLQQNLTAEMIQVSDQVKMIITNGTKKPNKVPPPVAKKPAHGTNPSNTENATIEQNVSVEVNCQSDTVHPAGQRAQASGSQDRARRTETTC